MHIEHFEFSVWTGLSGHMGSLFDDICHIGHLTKTWMKSPSEWVNYTLLCGMLIGSHYIKQWCCQLSDSWSCPVNGCVLKFCLKWWPSTAKSRRSSAWICWWLLLQKLHFIAYGTSFLWALFVYLRSQAGVSQWVSSRWFLELSNIKHL